MGNLMNAAHALGIGSCWIHRAKEEFESQEGKELLKSLGIQGDYEGIGPLYPGLSKGRSTGNPSKKRKLDILCRLMGYRRSLWSSRN